jgi:hypothetical protein
MSTRSNIGYLDPKTGKYHSVFVQWDGYMSHNGRILYYHYKTLNKVKMLVNLGAILSINKNVRPPKNPIFRNLFGKLIPVKKHTFDTPDRNTVVAYHRDYCETWENAKPTISDTFPMDWSWAYCFNDGKWLYKFHRMVDWKEITESDFED